MAKVGRPPFKPTAAMRRQVEELRSCGMSEDSIARAIGISTPTLQKHFAEELLNGSAKKRAEVIRMLYRSAAKGNVSAQKKLEEMTRQAALAEAMMVPRPTEAKAPKLGKKQQEAAAAEAAAAPGQKFAPPQPPKLVVNNG